MLGNVAKHPEGTDWHQYNRGFGHPRLASALAKLYSITLGVDVDGYQNVLVTVGAYLSLYYSFIGVLIPVVLILRSDPQSSKDYTLNVEAIEEKISKRTKVIVLINPHNPTGKLFTKLLGMYERTVTIGSAGKVFSITGWKLGWSVGPAELLEPLRQIH